MDDVASLLGAQVLETLAQAGDSGVLDLWLVVVEEQVEGLDEVVVGDVTAEGLGKLREVSSETQAHLPTLILTSVEKGAKSVHSVLLLTKIACHWDQGFNTEDAT